MTVRSRTRYTVRWKAERCQRWSSRCPSLLWFRDEEMRLLEWASELRRDECRDSSVERLDKFQAQCNQDEEEGEKTEFVEHCCRGYLRLWRRGGLDWGVQVLKSVVLIWDRDLGWGKFWFAPVDKGWRTASPPDWESRNSAISGNVGLEWLCHSACISNLLSSINCLLRIHVSCSKTSHLFLFYSLVPILWACISLKQPFRGNFKRLFAVSYPEPIIWLVKL